MTEIALDDRRQLKKGANQLLDQNLAPGEAVRLIVLGSYSSALIGTDRRAFVYKQGVFSGTLFAKKFTSFDYGNLTGVYLKTGVMSGVIALEGPGIQSGDLSYWTQGKGDPMKLPSALALNRTHFERAKTGAATLRILIAAVQHPASAPPASAQPDLVDQIRRLGELRDAGVVTADEFERKKAELLARM